jgi:hypothetical protein
VTINTAATLGRAPVTSEIQGDARVGSTPGVIVKVVSQHVELRMMPYYEDKSLRPEYRFRSA